LAIQDVLPKSRLTMRYRTEIDGVPEDIELPFRLLITGDFSGDFGGQTDEKGLKYDLDSRHIHNLDGNNTDAVMKSLNIKLKKDGTDIILDSIDSFSPTKVAENFPDLKHQLIVRQMLNEVISNLSNSKKYRASMEKILNDPNAKATLETKLEDYKDLRVTQTETTE